MPARKKLPAQTTAPRKARRAPVAPVPVVEPTATPAPPEPQSVQPSATSKAGKPPKLRRKPVRDSFTMPEADFSLIAMLKARAVAAKRETKKSELLRAGLHALAALDRTALVQALSQLEPVKVGRPKKAR